MFTCWHSTNTPAQQTFSSGGSMDGGDIEGVGARIRQLREAKGLSATELAEQVGVTLSSVSKMERGHRQPSKKLRDRLAKILGVHPDSFLERSPGTLRQVPLVTWSDLLRVAIRGVPEGIGEAISVQVEGEKLIAVRLPEPAAPMMPKGAVVIVDLADDRNGTWYLAMNSGGLGGGKIPDHINIRHFSDGNWESFRDGRMKQDTSPD